MGLLATVALAILALGLLVAVAFFGRLPALRHTPVAWLHRLLVVRLPAAVLAADARLTGGRAGARLRRFGQCVVYDRHPTVLVFFVALLAGSEGLALPQAWAQLGLFNRVVLVLLSLLPYVFLYLAAATDPGTVTLASLRRHLDRYPYDFALFRPGVRCPTCRLLKPPRSKHCRVCKRCVGRLDHHCIFINNCVGVGNHHYFLLLLLSTGLLATYGGVVGLGLVADTVRTGAPCPGFSLWPWAASLRGGGPQPQPRLPWHLWLLYLTWGLRARLRVGCVCLLGVLISPLVWGLLGFNVWNVYAGQTTNESLKWGDWKDDMADGYVYRRVLGRRRDLVSVSRWPLHPSHVLVRTDDGKPPPPDEPQHPWQEPQPQQQPQQQQQQQQQQQKRPRLPGIGPWEPVWTLRDVDNLYDLGFWNNLVDVFDPDHYFAPAAAKGLPQVERGRPRRRGKQ